MSMQNTFSKGTIGILLAAGLGLGLTLSAPAHSSDAGAFVGWRFIGRQGYEQHES